MPSFAPSTAARSQPIRCVRCCSKLPAAMLEAFLIWELFNATKRDMVEAPCFDDTRNPTPVMLYLGAFNSIALEGLERGGLLARSFSGCSPDLGFVLPEMGEGLFQIPGPCGGQFAGEQGIELLPNPPAYPTAAAEQCPAHMLEPLGRFLALGPQACALGPAHLIHCLIQMAGDMESIQHVQSLAGLGRNDFQVGLPHVAAHKTQPFDGLRPQCLQAPSQCGLRTPPSHP